MSRNKEGDNREDVICKFIPGVTRGVVCCCISCFCIVSIVSIELWPGRTSFRQRTVNHEFCASFAEEPFDHFRSVTTESVFVLNDHFFDSSCVYLFQKGNKSLSFEIEAGSDVFDDGVRWVRFLEVSDLSFEVSCLVRTRDTGVTDFDLFGRGLIF